ncbi:MAG: phosphate signaling complex protein PhoU [Minwuia sp.]|uniref:phosphate signaling complex protein PhoU n=1 Tax=Minwuia sp. TaxID=2493630 RepID=UPI003A8BEF4E
MASEVNAKPHTVTAYEEELGKLNNTILELGGLVEVQIQEAMRAISRRDSEAAESVIRMDSRIDDLEESINEMAVRLLALRQPMAGDLRTIVSAIKIAGDLERAGDYAKNISKRTLVINQSPPISSIRAVPRMADLVQTMLNDVLTAYSDVDPHKAHQVWEADQEVDELYNSLFRELLTYMMEDPRNITAATHLLFVAKNLERMGDLVTNIAERIYFTSTGDQIEEDRPKKDNTSVTDAEGETVENEVL